MNLRDATKIINKADTGITLNKSEQKLAELMLHAPMEQSQSMAAKSMQQFMQTSEFAKERIFKIYLSKFWSKSLVIFQKFQSAFSDSC